MQTIVVTGAAGSIGSEACLHFSNLGYNIIGIENYTRGKILGNDGNTYDVSRYLKEVIPNFKLFELDIRNTEHPEFKDIISRADVIIHTAAQPSHPKSIEIPILDKELNIDGTIGLLELIRNYNNKNCIFLFCSTNKVYGENPNSLPIIEKETRYDYEHIDGIDESLSLDKTKHTPFGVSKVACDLYTQEYAKTYGLITGIFRLGCITGGNARAVECHNWEPYFVKKNLLQEDINIYGFKGKQVRDVIHVNDFVILLEKFIDFCNCNSSVHISGEVFNVGGGRNNSISLLESFDLIKSITGKEMKYKICDGREGDHKVYISDITKAKIQFDWKIEKDLECIFTELVEKQKQLL